MKGVRKPEGVEIFDRRGVEANSSIWESLPLRFYARHWVKNLMGRQTADYIGPPCPTSCSLFNTGSPYMDKEVRIPLIPIWNGTGVKANRGREDQCHQGKIRKGQGNIQTRRMSQMLQRWLLHLRVKIKFHPLTRVFDLTNLKARNQVKFLVLAEVVWGIRPPAILLPMNVPDRGNESSSAKCPLVVQNRRWLLKVLGLLRKMQIIHLLGLVRSRTRVCYG